MRRRCIAVMPLKPPPMIMTVVLIGLEVGAGGERLEVDGLSGGATSGSRVVSEEATISPFLMVVSGFVDSMSPSREDMLSNFWDMMAGSSVEVVFFGRGSRKDTVHKKLYNFI